MTTVSNLIIIYILHVLTITSVTQEAGILSDDQITVWRSLLRARISSTELV